VRTVEDLRELMALAGRMIGNVRFELLNEMIEGVSEGPLKVQEKKSASANRGRDLAKQCRKANLLMNPTPLRTRHVRNGFVVPYFGAGYRQPLRQTGVWWVPGGRREGR